MGGVCYKLGTTLDPHWQETRKHLPQKSYLPRGCGYPGYSMLGTTKNSMEHLPQKLAYPGNVDWGGGALA